MCVCVRVFCPPLACLPVRLSVYLVIDGLPARVKVCISVSVCLFVCLPVIHLSVSLLALSIYGSFSKAGSHTVT